MVERIKPDQEDIPSDDESFLPAEDGGEIVEATADADEDEDDFSEDALDDDD